MARPVLFLNEKSSGLCIVKFVYGIISTMLGKRTVLPLSFTLITTIWFVRSQRIETAREEVRESHEIRSTVNSMALGYR